MLRVVRLVPPLLLAFAAAAHGRGAVGVTAMTFTKTSVTTGAARPLATTIWYPAVPHTGTAETLGLRDARVRRGRFPLVVFSHGTCGRPTEASYLTMPLAALGFVVAAPAHLGDTADDLPGCLGGPDFVDSAANRVPDVRFVLDSMLGLAADRSSPFARRLRTDALGVSGLSFGGYTTLLAAQQEPRFTAALAMVPGGTVFLQKNDITIPAMVIGAEHDQVVGFMESENAYARLAGPRFLVELLRANHLSVVDDCTPFCVASDITQDAAHALVLHYALPFVARYLAHHGHGHARVLTRQIDGVVLTAEPKRTPAP
jgi:predicted dienelactone hydrolase